MYVWYSLRNRAKAISWRTSGCSMIYTSGVTAWVGSFMGGYFFATIYHLFCNMANHMKKSSRGRELFQCAQHGHNLMGESP